MCVLPWVFCLVCFDCRSVTAHRYAGILSAVGIHLADIVQEAQEPTAVQLSAQAVPELKQRLQALSATAAGNLKAQGFDPQHIAVENFLNLRYVWFVCVSSRGGDGARGGCLGVRCLLTWFFYASSFSVVEIKAFHSRHTHPHAACAALLCVGCCFTSLFSLTPNTLMHTNTDTPPKVCWH